MNTNSIAKNYALLTSEERFRLIFAASGRGDEAERDRLVRNGGHVELRMPAHAPYGCAFQDLTFLVYIELLEAAMRYMDALQLVDDVSDAFEKRTPEAADAKAGCDQDTVSTFQLLERAQALALIAGYTLRTKVDGWKLFCSRMNVPATLLWHEFPGFDRIKRASTRAEEIRLGPEGFTRCVRHVDPKCPALASAPLTVEGFANATEETYRARVNWWSGNP